MDAECSTIPTSIYGIVVADGESVSDLPPEGATQEKPGVKCSGDDVGTFDAVDGWSAPNGAANIDDAVAAIKTWQGGQVVAPVGNVAHLSACDVEPGDINTVVNFNDVFTIILAFQGEAYPYGPADADGNCP